MRRGPAGVVERVRPQTRSALHVPSKGHESEGPAPEHWAARGQSARPWQERFRLDRGRTAWRRGSLAAGIVNESVADSLGASVPGSGPELSALASPLPAKPGWPSQHASTERALGSSQDALGTPIPSSPQPGAPDGGWASSQPVGPRRAPCRGKPGTLPGPQFPHF